MKMNVNVKMSKTVEIDSGYQEDHEFFILQIIIS